MTEAEMKAVKEAYECVPSQDNEGWVPDRGSFKAGFFAALRWYKSEIEALRGKEWKERP